ncbi:MAG TPA: hypothetical protein VNZ53_54595, partial [Steroidobacteraceae bacterium]|nr:hypothetical protein [Steroidobacteraceae bacterium]
MSLLLARRSPYGSVGLIAFSLAIAWTAPMKAGEGDLKLVRATLSRSLSAPFIWGLNPIGEKYGLRAQVLDAMTN